MKRFVRWDAPTVRREAGRTLMLLCGAVCFLLLKGVAQRDFGGLRGDLVGSFLQMSELCSLVCVVAAQKGGWL